MSRKRSDSNQANPISIFICRCSSRRSRAGAQARAAVHCKKSHGTTQSTLLQDIVRRAGVVAFSVHLPLSGRIVARLIGRNRSSLDVSCTRPSAGGMARMHSLNSDQACTNLITSPPSAVDSAPVSPGPLCQHPQWHYGFTATNSYRPGISDGVGNQQGRTLRVGSVGHE